jgi:carbonic anhydrase
MTPTAPQVIRRLLFILLFIGFTAGIIFYFAIPDKPKAPWDGNPESSLLRLMEGNARFVKGEMRHQGESVERRTALSSEQKPFAVIVSCSDSRVPPELVFDQGLGDLFVIRTAGNLVDSIALGSIEYAVKHLGVKLIVVMGHENCGVIKAFLVKEPEHDYIDKLVDIMSNEPEQVAALTAPGDRIDNCVRANIKHITTLLKTCEPVLMEKYKSGELKITSARYDLDKGTVEITE